MNRRRSFPPATAVLVAVNALVFGMQLFLAPAAADLLLQRAGAIPLELTSWRDIPPRNLVPLPLTIFTSMFLHGGWMHIVGNMWFLWLFGPKVEERLGSVRFAAFYLLTGAVGAVAESLIMPESRAQMLGASGAVAGVLGGYTLLFPHSRILTLIPIPFFWHVTPVRAWIFLGLWFLGQFFIDPGAGIAWMAHVGGFLAGIGAVRLAAPGARPGPFGLEAPGPQRG